MEEGVNPPPITSIYLHIPFCDVLCPYCHFVKVPLFRFDTGQYLACLVKEIVHRLPEGDTLLQTIYIGGGTPSLLNEQQLAQILAEIKKKRGLARHCEITLEANPNHVTPHKLKIWRDVGVTRLSVGVQSFGDDELNVLGRDHRGWQAKEAVMAAAAAGFSRLSLDLLAGLRGQTGETLIQTLLIAVSLPIDHLSLYLLEGRGVQSLSDEDMADLYCQACHFLKEAGFLQYEISNFARPGGQSRHNRVYWRNGGYYGFGAAASSFDGQVERRNRSSLSAYMREINSFGVAVASEDRPNLSARRRVTGLRLRAGLPQWFFDEVRPATERLLAVGALELHLGRIRVAERHILLTNSILTELI